MRIPGRDNTLNKFRRRFLRHSGAAAALCALSTSFTTKAAIADEVKTLRLALSWIPNFQSADLWVALERGYYDDRNLVIDWRPGGPNTPNPVERVASGELDIGQQETLRVVLEAISKGNDFVIFGARYQRRPGGILSLAKSPIKTVQDLIGKRIICPSAVDARTVETSLKIAGLPTDFTFVPGGVDPYGLIRGQGDGMVAFATNQPILLEEQGLVAEKDFFHRSWDVFGQPGYNTIFFTRRDYLKENRDAVVQFIRGLIWGGDLARSDKNMAAKLTVDKYGVDYGLDYEQQKRALEIEENFIHSDNTKVHGLFSISKDRLAGPVYDALRAGGIDALPDVDAIVDTSIVADASTS